MSQKKKKSQGKLENTLKWIKMKIQYTKKYEMQQKLGEDRNL